MTLQIKKAERKQARARIGMSGPSGSGKTTSALLVAQGLVEGLRRGGVAIPADPIGVVDTERGSASLYADLVDFVTIDMEPPYSPQRYMEAMDALEAHGCLVIVLDQISHAWAGEGGLLEKVDALKATSRNKMEPWAQVTPMQQRFIDRMLTSKAHVVATMRSKTEWVIEQGKAPRRVGLSPVQRDGIEYEFTTMFDIDAAHQAVATKDRTRIFGGRILQIEATHGIKLAEWLLAGAPSGTAEFSRSIAAPPIELPPQPKLTPKEEARREVDPPEDGFGAIDPDAVIGPEVVKRFWVKVRERAKALDVDAEKLARAVLTQFNVPEQSSKQIRQSDYPEVMMAVHHFQVSDLV